MQLVSQKRLGKRAYNNRGIAGNAVYIPSVQSDYKEDVS
jgi:hypothetical protein